MAERDDCRPASWAPKLDDQHEPARALHRAQEAQDDSAEEMLRLEHQREASGDPSREQQVQNADRQLLRATRPSAKSASVVRLTHGW
jgi:hypothetical protein